MIDSGSQIVNAIIGGAVMSVTTSLHLLLKGKITGMSGAIFNVIHNEDIKYNGILILGMISIAAIIKIFSPNSSVFFESTEVYHSDLSFIGYIISGFLVGFGSKLGNGCTSGHGVCGLPRFSKRSIVAIIEFMIFGISMATIRKKYPFLQDDFLS